MNFRRITFRILLFILFILSQTTVAQQDSTAARLSGFAKNIHSFNRLYPQEKVYLHFDNTGYYLGETIWFKAYVVTAAQNTPTTLSRVLYVELLNPEGDIVETKKLKVENGQCHGDFQLKDSLFAGYYEVRAYTRYMLNFGSLEPTETKRCPEITDNSVLEHQLIDNSLSQQAKDTTNSITTLQKLVLPGNPSAPNTCPFSTETLNKKCIENESVFSRVFPIYNQPNKTGRYIEKIMYERRKQLEGNKDDDSSPMKLVINFYPESGQLINGITSKVAFKASTNKGEQLNIKGSIKNSVGKEIARLETTHQGMGCFTLTPDGNPYTAEVLVNKKKYEFILPQSKERGYVLSTDTLPNRKLCIKVQGSGIEPQQLGLSICCRGKIVYFDTLSIKQGEDAQLIISTRKLNTGVNEIILFNGVGEILASRLIFVNHKEYNDLHLSCSVKQNYQPYESVNLDFQLKDELNETKECLFSLAVRDADTEERTYNTVNILSNLLLSSDLKGYIANPAWYFEVNDKQHILALDLLMLTQGWRRYAWKEMAGVDPFKLEQPVEKGIMIDGTLKSKQNERISNAQVSISLNGPNKLMKYADLKANKDGYFKVLVGDIQGAASLTLVALKENQKRTVEDSIELSDFLFELNRHFSPRPKSAYSYYENNIPEELADKRKNIQAIDSRIKTLELNAVTVKAKKKKYKKLKSLIPNYRISGPEEVDKIRDYLLLNDGYDRDSDVKMVKFIQHVCLRRGLYNMTGLIIRDIPYEFREWSYSYSDLDSIYIYTDLADRKRYSHRFGNSLDNSKDILVKIKSTKKDAPTKWEDGTRRTKLQGYSCVSEFYSPNYKNNVLQEKKDFRRTLYWNPDVKTDSTGRATVTFFNNSTCKRINISAETVTEDGVPVVYKE